MIRSVSIALVLAGSLMPIGTPAAAQAAQSGYLARPETAPAKSGFIVRDRMWKCAGGTCAGPRSTSSERTACALAARELGPLAEFRVDGQPIDAEQLAACNARAG